MPTQDLTIALAWRAYNGINAKMYIHIAYKFTTVSSHF